MPVMTKQKNIYDTPKMFFSDLTIMYSVLFFVFALR